MRRPPKQIAPEWTVVPAPSPRTPDGPHLLTAPSCSSWGLRQPPRIQDGNSCSWLGSSKHSPRPTSQQRLLGKSPMLGRASFKELNAFGSVLWCQHRIAAAAVTSPHAQRAAATEELKLPRSASTPAVHAATLQPAANNKSIRSASTLAPRLVRSPSVSAVRLPSLSSPLQGIMPLFPPGLHFPGEGRPLPGAASPKPTRSARGKNPRSAAEAAPDFSPLFLEESYRLPQAENTTLPPIRDAPSARAAKGLEKSIEEAKARGLKGRALDAAKVCI